mgnify:FL=1
MRVASRYFKGPELLVDFQGALFVRRLLRVQSADAAPRRVRLLARYVVPWLHVRVDGAFFSFVNDEPS